LKSANLKGNKVNNKVSKSPSQSTFNSESAKYGSELASSLGVPAIIGKGIGGLVGKIFGLGDYEVKENSVVSSVEKGSQVPIMHSEKDSVIVRHREMLGNVMSSTAFSQVTYAMNPGLRRSFPWLAPTAQNFTTYKLHGVVYEFVSLCADSLAASVPALGSVIMAARYDPTGNAFTDKVEMENSMWASSAKPSVTFAMPIECASGSMPLNQLYIRPGAISAIQNIANYDMGYFTIATQGQQAAGVNIGELWCTYDIELFKPRIGGYYGIGLPYAYYSGTSSPANGQFGGATVSSDNIGLQFPQNSGNGTYDNVTMPISTAGNYLYCYQSYGGSATYMTTDPTFHALNMTALDPSIAFTSHIYNAVSGSFTQCYSGRVYDVTVPTAYYQVNSGTSSAYVGATFSWRLVVLQFNGAVGGPVPPTLLSASTFSTAPAAKLPARIEEKTEDDDNVIVSSTSVRDPSITVATVKLEPEYKASLSKSVSAIRWN